MGIDKEGHKQLTRGVELEKQATSNTHSRCSTPSSSSTGCCVPVESIADHVACGLCRGPVASSMLLNCSHLFCGSCLFSKLQERACCPTCNMDLRAIPIRCLAMDKIAASVVPSLSTDEQQQYSKRKQDGQCVADQINKMFHHLAPPALQSLNPVLNRPAASIPAVPSATCSTAAGYLEPLNPMAPRVDSAEGLKSLQPALQQHSYFNPMNFSGLSAAAAAAAPNLLQLVAAQQLAQLQQVQQQLQQVQQQLQAMHINPAAAAGAHTQYPCGQLVPDELAVQQLLLGRSHEHSRLFGARSLPDMSAAAGYHELQLSSMMGSMCQV